MNDMPMVHQSINEYLGSLELSQEEWDNISLANRIHNLGIGWKDARLFPLCEKIKEKLSTVSDVYIEEASGCWTNNCDNADPDWWKVSRQDIILQIVGKDLVKYII